MAKHRQLIICVGAAKAGTSSLHTALALHPAIAGSNPKETDFFVSSQLCEKGLDIYFQKYFNPSGGQRIFFEADPIYMYARDGIRNIHQLAPDAQIIVMLRHPVERAFSQYLYRMTYGRYGESFEEMCVHEAERIRRSDWDRLEYGCLDRSTYAPQIAEILKYFPRERVYFILFEDFVRNQQAEITKLLKWLGLSPMKFAEITENPGGKPKSLALARFLFHPKYRVIRRMMSALLPRPLTRGVYGRILKANLTPFNRGNKPRLKDETLRSLMALFAKDIEAVQAMTQLDLSGWLGAKFSPQNIGGRDDSI